MIYLKQSVRGAGYVMNDDRCSGGAKNEADIVLCGHCQKAMKVLDWKEDGGHCGKCAKAVCGPCADKMLTRGCEPFMQQIEKIVQNNYHAKQLARMLGI